MILIYADGSSGQIALSSQLIEGFQAEARTYNIVDHWVEVDGGGNDTVAVFDADEICRMKGYRMALPIEQNEYTKSKRKSGKLTEKAVGTSDGKGD